MTAPAQDLRLHTTIAGRYRLDRVLGAGGMGVVYAGTHTLLDRPVAVKLLHAEYARLPEARTRFVREATASAKLRHPNVVEVYDAGETEDGAAYLVLELLQGEPLANYLEIRPCIDAETVLSIFQPVVGAIAYAHEHGFVHRDLKPDNIFLSRDVTGRSVPKVLDFGIAKSVGGGGATQTGAVLGTPVYMAPEQAHGRSDVGVAADVWSLGVILFECLSGRLPFNFPEQPTITQILFAVAFEKPLSLVETAPHVPRALASLVDRCLVQDAARRIPDAKTLGAALASLGTPAAREFVPSNSATFPAGVRPVAPQVPVHSFPETPSPFGVATGEYEAAAAAEKARRGRIVLAALVVTGLTALGAIGFAMRNASTDAPLGTSGASATESERPHKEPPSTPEVREPTPESVRAPAVGEDRANDGASAARPASASSTAVEPGARAPREARVVANATSPTARERRDAPATAVTTPTPTQTQTTSSRGGNDVAVGAAPVSTTPDNVRSDRHGPVAGGRAPHPPTSHRDASSTPSAQTPPREGTREPGHSASPRRCDGEIVNGVCMSL